MKKISWCDTISPYCLPPVWCLVSIRLVKPTRLSKLSIWYEVAGLHGDTHCLLEESLAGPCLHCLCECWPGPSQWLRRQPWEYLFCVLYCQRSARHQVTRVTQQSQSTHYVTDDVRLDNAVAGDDCIYLEGDWTECDNKARVRLTFLPWYGLQITSWMLSDPEQRRLASSLPYYQVGVPSNKNSLQAVPPHRSSSHSVHQMCLREVKKCALDWLLGKVTQWGRCERVVMILQAVGVTQKVLHLVSGPVGGGCPRQKLITRPCGGNSWTRRLATSKRRRQAGVESAVWSVNDDNVVHMK